MTTKLTLTIENKVIDSAKKYAHNKGESLSGIVENYLKAITKQEDTIHQLSPKVTKLLGIVKIPEDFDYKKELVDAISQKYR